MSISFPFQIAIFLSKTFMPKKLFVETSYIVSFLSSLFKLNMLCVRWKLGMNNTLGSFLVRRSMNFAMEKHKGNSGIVKASLEGVLCCIEWPWHKCTLIRVLVLTCLQTQHITTYSNLWIWKPSFVNFYLIFPLLLRLFEQLYYKL